MYKSVQTFPGGISQNLPVLCRYIFLGKHPAPNGIIYIMVNICNFIRKTHNFSFHGRRHQSGLMIHHPVPYLPGKIQSPSALFQFLHNADTLLIMPESSLADFIQHMFPCMSKGRMPQIMSQRNGLHQVFIQPQRLCNGAGILGYFQGMGQSGTVMISPGRQKHLRLVLQPAE